MKRPRRAASLRRKPLYALGSRYLAVDSGFRPLEAASGRRKRPFGRVKRLSLAASRFTPKEFALLVPHFASRAGCPSAGAERRSRRVSGERAGRLCPAGAAERLRRREIGGRHLIAKSHPAPPLHR